MLEIRKNEDPSNPTYQFLINGIQTGTVALSEPNEFYPDEEPSFKISLSCDDVLNEGFDSCFSDIPKEVKYIDVSLRSDIVSKSKLITVDEVTIVLPDFEALKKNISHFRDYRIDIFFLIDINNWNGLRSPNDYFNIINSTVEKYVDADITLDEYNYNFIIRFSVRSPELKIKDELNRYLLLAHKFLDTVEDRVTSLPYPNSIIKSFNFPEEVSISCEQYLLYFVQFLRDLGVNATSDLKHEAGRVLFTVTPSSEEEALDKILTALEVYLRLPSSPVRDDVGSEIAIQRLESQVLRFQSDLKLAAAELQAKNATIEAQQLTMNVQKALLSGELIMNTIKDLPAKQKEDDREELFGGTVALTVFKKGGTEVSLAKLYRRLKELFKEKS